MIKKFEDIIIEPKCPTILKYSDWETPSIDKKHRIKKSKLTTDQKNTHQTIMDWLRKETLEQNITVLPDTIIEKSLDIFLSETNLSMGELEKFSRLVTGFEIHIDDDLVFFTNLKREYQSNNENLG